MKHQVWDYPATIVEGHDGTGAYDGDSIHIDIDLGFRAHWIGLARLSGIDAPELPTPEGIAARDFLRGLLPVGTVVVVDSWELDKYGRPLLDVYRRSDGKWVNEEMLTSGHAVPYHGGKR